MADQNDERKLDELLDSALSEYSAVEPRLGLETRILARIRGAALEPNTPWWSARWLVAGAVVSGIAAILLSVLLFRPAQKPQQVQIQPNHPQTIQPQIQQDSKVTTAKTAPVRRERRLHHAQAQQELARSDRPSVFPTPTGLSEQEELMLAYVAQTPKEEIVAQMRPPNREEEEEFWKDQQPAVVRPQR